MGIFDKKYCDICGEKIGLLGNRKLEDGNLCKNCANKLSPLFSERRHSTVEEIRKQLAYREENERCLSGFHPDITFGEVRKIYIDRNSGQLIVTSASNWKNANPDLIKLSQITGISTDIHENKTELYYQDEEGKRKSYMPRRYECDYEFNITLLVDSPWFDKIELELSAGNRPDSPYTDLYRRYEEQMHTLSSIINGAYGSSPKAAANAPRTREQELIEETIKSISWMCAECGIANSGTSVCRNCGAEVNDERALEIAKNLAHAKMLEENGTQARVCPSCGSPCSGKFCENCGTPLSQ